jgi:HTH-type transcriptional regulator / antitoxin HigA
MKLKMIKTKKDYSAARREVERLVELDPDHGTPRADRLEVMALLVENYEKKAFPIPRCTPLDAIRFRMDQMGLLPKDLVPYLGSRARVSEVLSGKRGLSLKMIRALHQGLDIPAEVLIREPEAGRQENGRRR